MDISLHNDSLLIYAFSIFCEVLNSLWYFQHLDVINNPLISFQNVLESLFPQFLESSHIYDLSEYFLLHPFLATTVLTKTLLFIPFSVKKCTSGLMWSSLCIQSFIELTLPFSSEFLLFYVHVLKWCLSLISIFSDFYPMKMMLSLVTDWLLKTF